MKRRLGAITAVLCLVGAGTAYAAGPVTGGPNSYTGNFAVAGGAGTAKKPVAVSWTETLGVTNTNPSDVGAPLVSIRTTTYGLKAPNAALFPKCTANEINELNGHNGKWNTVCPKGSLVAQGTVTAALTSPTVNLAGPGAPCALGLWAYNAGPGKLTYFLTTTPQQCDGNQTGAAAAWQGTVSEAGKNLVTDVPEPADASYNAAGIGLFGSLQTQVLKYKKLTVKKGNKVYPFLESTGCLKHARPFTITYVATQSTTGSPTLAPGTVTGSANC
jgi:hypothetical protein